MFLVVAAVGLVLLIVALVFDDVLDAVVPDNDWLSLPSLAAGLVAFGSVAYIMDSQTGVPVGAAVGLGSVVAVGCGWLAFRFSRAAMGMATDATPAIRDMLGSSGRVVTAIAAGSTGEVLVEFGGQLVKMTALAADGSGIATGVDIVVVSVESQTRVKVETASEFWSDVSPRRSE